MLINSKKENIKYLLFITLLLNFYRKIWQHNYHFVIFGMFTFLLISIPGSALGSSKSPYESGYDHGCDDAGISDSSDRYINQPEKGPSFHTSEFMDGYNSGFNSCSSSNNNYNSQSGNDRQSSSRSNQPSSEECVNDVNEFGEFASNFLPGSKVVTKFGAKLVC